MLQIDEAQEELDKIESMMKENRGWLERQKSLEDEAAVEVASEEVREYEAKVVELMVKKKSTKIFIRERNDEVLRLKDFKRIRIKPFAFELSTRARAAEKQRKSL